MEDEGTTIEGERERERERLDAAVWKRKRVNSVQSSATANVSRENGRMLCDV